ncbi:MAG: hypothetical protein KHY27_09010, partial [Butyricicoccus pullicaecorum]|nr:hypothetical protein [Butyricicoccus pullicaecorum]
MSLEPTRKSPSSDEDDSLLDADLLAIFGDTPDEDQDVSQPAPADEPAEDTEALPPFDEDTDEDVQPESLDESDPLDEFEPFSDLPDEDTEEAPPAEPLQVPEQPEAIPVSDSPKVEPPRKRTDEDNYRVYLLKNLSSAHTAACIEGKLRK